MGKGRWKELIAAVGWFVVGLGEHWFSSYFHNIERLSGESRASEGSWGEIKEGGDRHICTSGFHARCILIVESEAPTTAYILYQMRAAGERHARGEKKEKE